MLKTQHPTDYLKKESEIAEQMGEEQHIEQIAWQQGSSLTRFKRSDEELFVKSNKASSLDNQGKHQEALKIYEEINQKYRQELREDHPNALMIRNNMALVLDHQGRYQEALKILAEVYRKQKGTLLLENSFTLSTRSNMAVVLDHQGKYQEALEIFKEVYEKRKEILGQYNSNTLATRNRIALALDHQGKYQEALEILEEVYQKREEILDSDALIILSSKALVLSHQGKHQEASEIFGEVYQKRKEILGQYHPDTLRTRNNEAMELSSLKKYQEALEISQEVLQKQTEMLGLNHPDVLVTMSNVGLILNSQGEHQEALGVLNEVYEKRKEVLGQYHPNTLITMNNIASVLEDQYRYQEALKIYKEVYEKVQELFEMDYSLTLLVRNGIVSTLEKQISVGSELKNLGKYQEALKIYEEVYQEQREVLGPDHHDTLLTKNNIAAVLDKQGTYNEALQIYKEVFDIEKVVLGPDHPNTLLTKNNIVLLDKKIHSLLANCLTRRRRDINNCQFSWEDIDQFNGEDESRNPNKIEIDSEKFIPYIRDIDESKRIQLIQIADQVKVTGKFQGLVNSLISNQKVMNHLSKVQRSSSITMHGMMAKATLAAFLNGDEKGVAINLGFIAGGQGFSRVAQAASVKGAGLVADGKIMLGRSLKAASPFLARGTSAFVVYDLVNQVKAFKNGTEDALVGVVGDSIYLGVDVAEIGIEVAEAFGVLEGVSSVTGPIGAAIGAVIFVGTDIYLAVKRVDKIDEIIHLTGKERFIEGLRAFIGMKPEAYIEELMEEKQINDQLVKQGFEYLKQHSNIQKYVFSTGKLIVDSCRSIPHNTTVCISGEFPCSIDRRTVTYYTEKCTTKFQVDLNNTILLGKEQTYAFFNQAKIDKPNEGEILCSPAKMVNLLEFRESVIAGEFLGLDDNRNLRLSLNSLVPEGYERMSKAGYFCHNAIGIATNNSGKYTLIDLGDGDDYAEGSLSKNIFLIGNGSKRINGGTDAIFIFNGNSTTGYINGGNGSDTIDIGEFALREKVILVDLAAEKIKYGNNSLAIVGMNHILARKKKRDKIRSGCSTEHIDGRSGENSDEKDLITIPPLDCFYKMQLIVRPNTTVYNQALRGNFSYIVSTGTGEADINLQTSNETRHDFLFNNTLYDLKTINSSGSSMNYNISLGFSDHSLTISSNTNNTFYRFNDNTEVKIGENNLYAIQRSNKSVDEIIRDYSAMANKLKMYIFVQSLPNNEAIAIGHGNHDVLSNNPFHKSHLIGNGGENIFVITSGYEMLDESRLPIPEVVIYDVDKENKVDTLDLRQVKQQIKRDLSREVEARIIVSNQDLLITLLCLNPVKIITTIKLKDALVSDWYDRLSVILDNVHMKIEKGIWLDHFDLKSLPLVFAEDKEIIVVKPEDIEKENKLVISRKAGDYAFARSGDDLIITSAFDRNLTNNEFCTICLNNFYQEPKMETLSIKFTDKEILLKDEMDRINNASILTKQLAQYKNDTYNTVFDHGNTISNITDLHQRKRREVKGYEDQEFFYARSNVNTGLKEEKVTNSGSRPTSWIASVAQWVKGFIGRPTAPSTPGTENSANGLEINAAVVHNTLLLGDVAARLITGNKYKQPKHDSLLSPKELIERRMDNTVINAINNFEKICDDKYGNDFQNATNNDEPMTCLSNISMERHAIKDSGSVKGIL